MLGEGGEGGPLFGSRTSRDPPTEQVYRDASRLLGNVSKLAARIERIRSNNAISAPELYRVMREMGRVVEAQVKDLATLEKITAGWLSIRMRVGPQP